MASATPTPTGGSVYVPPPRAAAAAAEYAAGDKAGPAYQRRTWDALKRSITGLVNKATAANVRHVLPELLAENLVRGRGLLCRALLRSQAAYPAFTDVFAALAAVVNSKIPDVGRILLVRLVMRLRRAHATGDKPQLAAAARFVAHLVNQAVAHELLALELLEMLLADNVTADGVEVAVGLVTECGAALSEACPRALDAVFDRLRSVLVEGGVDKRVGFLIEGVFAVRRSQFRGHTPVRPELDLVEEDDQFTHQVEVSLEVGHGRDDQLDPETHLDVFTPSATFLQDEAAYDELKRSMLGDGGDHSNDDSDDGNESDSEDEDMEVINDKTETDLIGLRRTIYLTIMSSAGAEEAGLKLLSIARPGQEEELCSMIVECCRQETASSNTKFYGQLAQRLCSIDRAYHAGFEACFARCYEGAHHMGTDELRSAAGLFAHLLATDAVPWRAVLGGVRITEEDTTSSTRIFIKALFQEMAEQLGVRVLGRRMNDDDDPVVRDALFPRDSAKNARFAINFFTAIGLGGVNEPARKLWLSCTTS